VQVQHKLHAWPFRKAFLVDGMNRLSVERAVSAHCLVVLAPFIRVSCLLHAEETMTLDISNPSVSFVVMFGVCNRYKLCGHA
jgi:hypothetical protein